jgi:hypothetical protein
VTFVFIAVEKGFLILKRKDKTISHTIQTPDEFTHIYIGNISLLGTSEINPDILSSFYALKSKNSLKK